MLVSGILDVADQTDDQTSLARIANATSRRNVLALMGRPHLTSADHAKGKEDHPAELYDSTTLLLKHEEKTRDLNDVWRENTNDSAGVGATAAAGSNEQDGQILKTTASIQRAFEDVDGMLRKQLLGPTSKSKHSGVQHRTANGRKPDGWDLRRKKQDDEISSEEEQGRSGLVASSKTSTNNPERPKKKKAKLEIETFQSMRAREMSSQDDAEDNEEVGPVVEMPAKRSSRRPKSYLDEALEASRNKQQKRMKKQMLKSGIGQ